MYHFAAFIFIVILFLTLFFVAVRVDILMQLWVFHQIIPTALLQLDLHQRCGIRTVGYCANHFSSDFILILWNAFNRYWYFMTCSLSWWACLHLNSSCTWGRPKWLWACKWTLDTCAYSEFLYAPNSSIQLLSEIQ